jgi:hypothetical protein
MHPQKYRPHGAHSYTGKGGSNAAVGVRQVREALQTTNVSMGQGKKKKGKERYYLGINQETHISPVAYPR